MGSLQYRIELGRKKTPVWSPSHPPSRLHRVLQHEVQKRQSADQALRRSEHRYQSIFEHALEGIFQTSREGKYIAANPALVQMYGYGSLEELEASINNIGTQLYVDPNRRAEFVRLMQERGQVLHFESEVRRRDGSTMWISENVRSIADEVTGEFLYYEGTVDDITDIKLAQEKLHRTYAALKQTQRRLEDELGEAANYVRSLLPAPMTGPVETHYLYLPCSHLGGDGFGYHWLDAGTLAFYLLDVSGHGVGSALLSISVLNVLRQQLLVATDFRDPSAVLEGLNRAFPMDRNNDKYFTIWYGVYHVPTRMLHYASAGHHPALLITCEGKGIRLQTHGSVIGVTPEMKYPSESVELSPGAELYLFSDGVFEIARDDGSYQLWEEFAQYVQEERPKLEQIEKRMRELHGAAEFDDDFSLLQLRMA
jgi:PAS domain S-box-containing protein